MEFVDLRTGYLLTGFVDFESALSATEQFCGKGFKVAYLNEADHVQDREVREFARCFGEPEVKQYQNYHYTLREQPKAKAAESLKTAVEVSKISGGKVIGENDLGSAVDKRLAGAKRVTHGWHSIGKRCYPLGRFSIKVQN